MTTLVCYYKHTAFWDAKDCVLYWFCQQHCWQQTPLIPSSSVWKNWKDATSVHSCGCSWRKRLLRSLACTLYVCGLQWTLPKRDEHKIRQASSRLVLSSQQTGAYIRQSFCMPDVCGSTSQRQCTWLITIQPNDASCGYPKFINPCLFAFHVCVMISAGLFIGRNKSREGNAGGNRLWKQNIAWIWKAVVFGLELEVITSCPARPSLLWHSILIAPSLNLQWPDPILVQ